MVENVIKISVFTFNRPVAANPAPCQMAPLLSYALIRRYFGPIDLGRRVKWRVIVYQYYGRGICTKREFPTRNFEDEFAGVHTNLTKVTTADRLGLFVDLFEAFWHVM